MKTVCVFCGSSNPKDPNFGQAADRLGMLIAQQGLRLVYGGGNVGLMGRVSQAVMKAGGHVTGVIPEKLNNLVEPALISELVVVPDMHSRKSHMYEQSDAFIAMAGGIGTLEELFEVYTWQQLGYHSKPLALLNLGGFFDPLVQMLDRLVETGFFKQEHRDNLIVARTPDEALSGVKDAKIHKFAKLPERR